MMSSKPYDPFKGEIFANIHSSKIWSKIELSLNSSTKARSINYKDSLIALICFSIVSIPPFACFCLEASG